jgi:hypothetical protein
MLHIHSDKLINTCPICQEAIKKINKAGKELDSLGVWSFPKKFKKGDGYMVWTKR